MSCVLFVPTAGYYFLTKGDEDAKYKALPDADVFVTSIELEDFEEFLSSGNELAENAYISKLPYPVFGKKQVNSESATTAELR